MSSGTQYYLLLNEVQNGPFTSLQLRSMWTTGSITAATLCWHEGIEGWEPLGTSIEDLIEQDTKNAGLQQKREEFQKRTEKADVMGIVIVLIPLAASPLLWWWISLIPLDQNPALTLAGVVIGIVVLTSLLIAIDAAQIGMGKKLHGKITTGPIGWFVGGILLWCVVYPSYLFSRRNFGLKNHLAAGIFSMLCFSISAVGLNQQIVSQKQAVIEKAEAYAREQAREQTRQQAREEEPMQRELKNKLAAEKEAAALREKEKQRQKQLIQDQIDQLEKERSPLIKEIIELEKKENSLQQEIDTIKDTKDRDAKNLEYTEVCDERSYLSNEIEELDAKISELYDQR